jgi:hypothetical protein
MYSWLKPIMLLIVISSSYISHSQVPGILSRGESIAPFLRFSPDSRGLSLGGTGIASKADAFSIHYNPAKISAIQEKYQISASSMPSLFNLVPDMNISGLSGTYKIDTFSAISISLKSMNWGQWSNTLNQSPVQLNDFNFNAAYSRKLSDKLSAGIVLKYTKTTSLDSLLNKHKGFGLAGDVAIYYNDQTKIRGKELVYAAGISLSNIGNKLSYDTSTFRRSLPENLGAGVAGYYNLNDKNNLGLLIDVNATGQGLLTNPHVDKLTWSIVLEYTYSNTFFLRSGYYRVNAISNLSSRYGFTGGLGIRYNDIIFDFGYVIKEDVNGYFSNSLIENKPMFSLGYVL